MRLALAILAAAAAAAAPPRLPSERGCLIAWNAPANAANRARLVAVHPLTTLSLRNGVVGVDTLSSGKTTSTSAPTCLLTVSKAGTTELVTGRWHDGRVARWAWSHAFPTTRVVPGNVRLLADGRVTKQYRR